jgi:hypothetical protein
MRILGLIKMIEKHERLKDSLGKLPEEVDVQKLNLKIKWMYYIRLNFQELVYATNKKSKNRIIQYEIRP